MNRKISKPVIALHIVPTGIGASIGGFAGDAAPANALLASCVDVIITNPNVVNAACLHNIPDNMLYTEGYLIDQFCKAEIALRPRNNHKIGVVFDQSIPEDVLNININAMNACQAVYGIILIDHVITREPIGIEYFITEDNISSGTIQNTSTLLESCNELIQKGATAIAVVCFFPDVENDDAYASGCSVDPIGGIEAIISHLVCREFKIPSAHAPAFNYSQLSPSKQIVDKRAAAEYFSPTFLPCVLAGLRQAPQIVSIAEIKHNDLTIEDVSFLVTPHDCLGSVPVITSLKRNIEIIAVKNNSTTLEVCAKKLNFEDKVIQAGNYFEAAGYIMAKKNNIHPDSILR